MMAYLFINALSISIHIQYIYITFEQYSKGLFVDEKSKTSFKYCVLIIDVYKCDQHCGHIHVYNLVSL